MTQRKMGELLVGMGLKPGPKNNQYHDDTNSLRNIGLTRLQSSRAQTMAVVPEPRFREYVEKVGESDKELTASALDRGTMSAWRATDCLLIGHSNGATMKTFSITAAFLLLIVGCGDGDHPHPSVEAQIRSQAEELAKSIQDLNSFQKYRENSPF